MLPNINWTCYVKSEEFDNMSMKMLLTIYLKTEAVPIYMVINYFLLSDVKLIGKKEQLIRWVKIIGQRTNQ